MNILFTLNNMPYDTRSGSLITQSQVKTIKHGIDSFVYQGGKQWNALPADAKDIEGLNVFKNYIDKWTGPECHCGYCALCTMYYKDFVKWYQIPRNECWSNKNILTGADIYNLLKNVFYNYFTAGKYCMCFMQNVYGTIFYMHIMHIGLIPASLAQSWVRNVFYLSNVSLFSPRHCIFSSHS